MLAEPSRRRVWEAVRAAGRPVGVAELAQALGVHPNTVRLHLVRLVRAGLALEEVETGRHPGRPGYRYRAAGGDPVSEAGAYMRLASLLTRAVRAGTGARAAGRAEGAASVAGAALAGGDPLDAIVVALATEGFTPEVDHPSAERIDVTLRTCPYAVVAAEDPATICQLHLGLAEGVAHALGGLSVDGLQVANPHDGGCTLRLRRT